MPKRPADELGFGVAAAFNGGTFARSQEAVGLPPPSAEVALEWTYRMVLTPWLALQPDVQYVINPGAVADRSNAVFLALRTEVNF